jgi:flagellar hook-associated protein 3 FlgL
MTSSTISSLALWDASRISMSRVQSQLGAASQEVTTGRHYDVGLALGTGTARAIDARVAIDDIDSIVTMNGVVGQRLSTMQSSMTAMLDLARSLFTEATQVTQSGVDRELFIDSAKSKLATLTSLLSSTNNGTFIFSGTNSLSAPVSDYLADPPPAARSAVVSAFTSEFSVAPDDPAVADITADQVKSYWNGTYSALFESPSWQTAFSSASDEPTELRIGPQEYASYSVSANDPGIRKLYSTLVALVDAGASDMNADAFGQLASLVASGAGAAAADLARSQAALGAVQSRLTNANDRMEIGRNLLNKAVGELEGVDQVEASTRLNSLTTQLQVSYAVTARMFKLSLLEYL